MKKKGILMILVASLLLILMISGCAKEVDDKIGEPSDYFPIDTGREWTYEITIGGAEPLYYYEVNWPLGTGGLAYAVNGRFRLLLEKEIPVSLLLKMKVKGPAAKQGRLEYPIGVELEIVQDELGIFEDHAQVFWAITTSDRFMAEQVVTYPPDTPGAPHNAWGGWGQENGWSHRLVFYGGEPGSSINLKDSPDEISFIGVDTNVPGFERVSSLHFQRKVNLEQEGKESSILKKNLTEDTWFVKDKGLVRFVQKVQGTTSMTWLLK